MLLCILYWWKKGERGNPDLPVILRDKDKKKQLCAFAAPRLVCAHEQLVEMEEAGGAALHCSSGAHRHMFGVVALSISTIALFLERFEKLM